MLKVLKIPNWKSIAPFAFYLNPLDADITIVRKSLLKMHKLGPLRMKYIIENNLELQKETMDMVKKDGNSQWLVGDELKQDQFKFFYDTTKIIYDSVLREKLVALDKSVLETVLP